MNSWIWTHDDYAYGILTGSDKDLLPIRTKPLSFHIITTYGKLELLMVKN